MKKNKWTCTDPDTKQYGRKISSKVYEFKQFYGGKWTIKTIDLKDYTEKEKESVILAYHSSMEELIEIYGKNDKEDSDWIIAECIFEQELFNDSYIISIR